MGKIVYLDHAAATPVDSRVQEAMLPYLSDRYGNPSSFHSLGKEAKDDLDLAREKIAKTLGAHSNEIIFTSGGTESDNMAILGYARKNKDHGRHLITTSIEHHAVIGAMSYLEKKEGFEVTYLPVDSDGLVNIRQVRSALREDTILVSVMYANNEIGVIQPVSEIGNMIRKWKSENDRESLQFHSDACQAAEYLDLNVEKLHVDMMTLNGSKIYGPKGVGLLYAKRGIKLEPIMFGGSQEHSLRPGTENVSGIVGLACALGIAQENREEESGRLIPLRDALIEGIRSRISKTRLNGHAASRLPNNVNISFLDIEGEALILYLNEAGVCVSTGSACASAELDPSHVILALGLPHEIAHGSVRFSLGRPTTKDQIDYVLGVLSPLVGKLRSISPVKIDEKNYDRLV